MHNKDKTLQELQDSRFGLQYDTTVSADPGFSRGGAPILPPPLWTKTHDWKHWAYLILPRKVKFHLARWHFWSVEFFNAVNFDWPGCITWFVLVSTRWKFHFPRHNQVRPLTSRTPLWTVAMWYKQKSTQESYSPLAKLFIMPCIIVIHNVIHNIMTHFVIHNVVHNIMSSITVNCDPFVIHNCLQRS